jgi:hypothetical protein
MLANFSRTADGGTAFYQAYYLHLMREVFAVMTDTFHTPGFKLHCRILQHLFAIVRTNQIQAPLWDPVGWGLGRGFETVCWVCMLYMLYTVMILLTVLLQKWQRSADRCHFCKSTVNKVITVYNMSAA